ncbi:MAG: hypothetical protein HC847_20235 [Hydrococcus sp. RU_2_2]|nr:hypothetical protein [Hydrococcus sp. RU_2_2]NJP19770.1 hypothetical protein [Hydrococcus sp. CRU_1_1]
MVYVFVPHAEVYLCLLDNQLTVAQIARRLHRKVESIIGEETSANSSRTPGLHPGAISINNNFDEPLPDDFWSDDSSSWHPEAAFAIRALCAFATEKFTKKFR